MAAQPVDDECDICFNELETPRVLDCDHIFCLDCLEKLEKKKTITCPACREVTDIPPGMFVRQLPAYVVGKEDRSESKVKLVKKIENKSLIVSIIVDTEARFIYAGLDNEETPIVIYGFNGKYKGPLSTNSQLNYAWLTLDTKRGIILASKRSVKVIYQINRKGLEVGTIACKEFRSIENLAYHVKQDLYIVADSNAQAVLFVDPDCNQVVKSVDIMSSDQWAKGRHVTLCCDHTGNNDNWAVSSPDQNCLSVYDMDWKCIRTYNNPGVGHGQMKRPDGMYMDKRGRLTVSDRENDRIVRLDPSLSHKSDEWKLIVNTKQFGLGKPRDIHVTEDGLAVINMWNKKADGVFHIGIFSGFS